MKLRIAINQENKASLIQTEYRGARIKDAYQQWESNCEPPITYCDEPIHNARSGWNGQKLQTVNPIDEDWKPPAPYKDKNGEWKRPNNHPDHNVLSYSRFLFEMDGVSLENQSSIITPLIQSGVIQRVVFSGVKSLHCVIEIEDAPTIDEMGSELGCKYAYKYIWHYLHLSYFLKQSAQARVYNKTDFLYELLFNNHKPDWWKEAVKSDTACSNPSRTTRSPFAMRCDEKTGNIQVEQTLLYFAPVRARIDWRGGYEECRRRKAREEASSRMRAEGMRASWKRALTPNDAALRFIAGDQSDGWKHEALGSAVASMRACGYTLEQVGLVFAPYKKELRDFAQKAYKYFDSRGQSGQRSQR
jgi:hypothetical protein